MNAEDLLAEVEELGVTVDVDGDLLRFRPGSVIPPRLVEALRVHKPELLEIVSLRGWPQASHDAVRQSRAPEARLYPFVGKAVATPDGPGRLLAVFSDRAGVALDTEPERVAFLLPSEVLPPDLNPQPCRPFEAVH